MWNKAQRRETAVRGDGNCFYRDICLWNDKSSDQNHNEVRSLVTESDNGAKSEPCPQGVHTNGVTGDCLQNLKDVYGNIIRFDYSQMLGKMFI